MPGSAPAIDSDASFTLDADLLAERRAANARRVHTVQLPAIRAGGFAILCVIAMLQDVRLRRAALAAAAVADPRPQRRLCRRSAGWSCAAGTGAPAGSISACSSSTPTCWSGSSDIDHLERAEGAALLRLLPARARVVDQIGFGARRALSSRTRSSSDLPAVRGRRRGRGTPGAPRCSDSDGHRRRLCTCSGCTARWSASSPSGCGSARARRCARRARS